LAPPALLGEPARQGTKYRHVKEPSRGLLAMEESDSSSSSDLEDEVAQLVRNVMEDAEADDDPDEIDMRHLWATRAATLYAALFEVKYVKNVLGLSPQSVYTASIVFPQIARSSGYQLTYVAISLKMICLTIICFVLQLIFVISLWQASVYRPTQGGGPHMCTYGQDTGNSQQTGPLGITINPDRSNLESNYKMLIIRNTLWEVLRHLNITNSAIGPVEFGTESASCRGAAVAAFFFSIILEVSSMWSTAVFLVRSPTLHSRNEYHAEQWISLAEPNLFTGNLRSVLGKSDLDCVTFKMAGMPLCWKILWAWPVLLCRQVIIATVAYVGFYFLMNTGGIVDLVLNCIALVFIVDMDKLSFAAFATHVTCDILQRLQPFRIPVSAEEVEAEVRKNTDKERHHSVCDRFRHTVGISKMLLSLMVVQWGAFFLYFHAHCVMDQPPFGSFVLHRSYFDSALTWRLAWESIVGNWHSKNTTTRPWLHHQSNQTICAPFGNGDAVVGCGLPSPWHGR